MFTYGDQRLRLENAMIIHHFEDSFSVMLKLSSELQCQNLLVILDTVHICSGFILFFVLLLFFGCSWIKNSEKNRPLCDTV